MLDLSSLSQLKQLKQDIHASVPRIKGTVKGTSKRFGFLVSEDDGQEYLLPQGEMERVLPGDYVQVVLQLNEKDSGKNGKKADKPIAKIEKFFSSNLPNFIGSVKVKNDQYYVIPDHAQLNRWIFIPPKYRKNLKDGDLISAKVCQHPFKNKGRVQAEVIAMIGQPGDPFIEHRYAIVKQGIEDKVWQQDELAAIRQTAEQTLEQLIPTKTDKRDLCFVTIDGPNTQDLDDALHIQKTDQGWQLDVAIADTSSFVEPGSALDKIAAKQSSSIYLPGQKVPMLPDVLSSNICSLRPNESRLAFICTIKTDNDAQIISCDYTQAVIKSKAKLAYENVAAFLETAKIEEGTSINEEVGEQLQMLNDFAKQRFQWRQLNALIMDEYADYRFQLDDKGKIAQITRFDRNQAQKLVEECMLCCNQATAAYLSKNAASGLFLSHNGFKQDQMPGIKKLFKNIELDIDADTLSDIVEYRALQKQLPALSEELPLRDILRKKLNRSEWSTQSTPHFGLGFDSYTTFTSPLRKYSDLICHRMIKGIIADEPLSLSDDELLQLNTANQAVRDAQRDCELNLKCQYIQQFKGQSYSCEISMINHRMIGVYLKEFDMHAQIEVRKLDGNFTFKQESLQLISDDKCYKLNQVIDITLDNIDLRQRQIRLKLTDTTS
ncbi:MAG: VacB/RNase II family 3'-5' exoribonuclease [Pseudomonadales bacterium]|nr:VacB/RNase II family 3'-5' exoribonuclease [Pseudomonadales bacterium]